MSEPVALINRRSGKTIASSIELAMTRSARRRGLLHHTALGPEQGLVLAPCLAVHTAFMRFAIDVMFVDRAGCVTKIVRHLRPWRAAASRQAYATIELAAGALDALDVVVGDRLYLEGAGLQPGRPSPFSSDGNGVLLRPTERPAFGRDWPFPRT